MSAPVRAVPEGYHSLSMALTCRNAVAAIEYYKSVFGAKEMIRMPSPDGKIMDAELKIGDSMIFVNDEFPGVASAPAPGVMPASYLFFYTEDVDTVYDRAVSTGSKVVMPLDNMFWGDRYGKFIDPFGHQWGVASHVEDVAPEEMKHRQEKAMAAQAAKSAGQS